MRRCIDLAKELQHHLCWTSSLFGVVEAYECVKDQFFAVVVYGFEEVPNQESYCRCGHCLQIVVIRRYFYAAARIDQLYKYKSANQLSSG